MKGLLAYGATTIFVQKKKLFVQSWKTKIKDQNLIRKANLIACRIIKLNVKELPISRTNGRAKKVYANGFEIFEYPVIQIGVRLSRSRCRSNHNHNEVPPPPVLNSSKMIIFSLQFRFLLPNSAMQPDAFSLSKVKWTFSWHLRRVWLWEFLGASSTGHYYHLPLHFTFT